MESIINIKENFSKTPAQTDEAFSRKKAFYLILIYFANSLIISSILGLIIMGICNLFKVDKIITDAIVQLFSLVVPVGLAVPFVYKAFYRDFKVLKNKLGLSLLLILGLGLAFILLTTLYSNYIEKWIIQLFVNLNIIDSEVYKNFSSSINQITIEKLLSNNISAWIVAPCLVFFGPLFEEIIFRKALFRLFNFKKPILNIITTGALFGAIHVVMSIVIVATAMITSSISGEVIYTIDNIFLESIFFVNYFISGIVLGTIYVITGYNIIPTLIIHVINNLMVFIILMFF